MLSTITPKQNTSRASKQDGNGFARRGNVGAPRESIPKLSRGPQLPYKKQRKCWSEVSNTPVCVCVCVCVVNLCVPTLDWETKIIPLTSLLCRELNAYWKPDAAYLHSNNLFATTLATQTPKTLKWPWPTPTTLCWSSLEPPTLRALQWCTMHHPAQMAKLTLQDPKNRVAIIVTFACSVCLGVRLMHDQHEFQHILFRSYWNY